MNRSLPIATAFAATRPRLLNSPELLSELQAYGLRWIDASGPGLSRRGGAGPSDHKAITLDHQTVMVPILNHASALSPYTARVNPDGQSATLLRSGQPIAVVTFPRQPHFYSLRTDEGVPYWKIATLHSTDVLATTVLQTCTRYGNRATACQFCAIGKSLAAKSTIAEKTPAQLAEVAAAAQRLDGVRHVVLTTGTPRTLDRGAEVLSKVAAAIKTATGLPIQAQCEPPADFGWFARLHAAGVDTLGLHLEAVTERVRQRIMPGKAEVPVQVYLDAFRAAVGVFGRGQVSTYILAGLGDSRAEILEMSERLISLGVYPFVVPFVPIAGTALEDEPPPEPRFLREVLDGVAQLLDAGGLQSSQIKAGCGRCGACSTLKAREVARA